MQQEKNKQTNKRTRTNKSRIKRCAELQCHAPNTRRKHFIKAGKAAAPRLTFLHGNWHFALLLWFKHKLLSCGSVCYYSHWCWQKWGVGQNDKWNEIVCIHTQPASRKFQPLSKTMGRPICPAATLTLQWFEYVAAEMIYGLFISCCIAVFPNHSFLLIFLSSHTPCVKIVCWLGINFTAGMKKVTRTNKSFTCLLVVFEVVCSRQRLTGQWVRQGEEALQPVSPPAGRHRNTVATRQLRSQSWLKKRSRISPGSWTGWWLVWVNSAGPQCQRKVPRQRVLEVVGLRPQR